MFKNSELDGVPGVFVVIAAFKLAPEWQALEERDQLARTEQAAHLVQSGGWKAEIDVYISRGLKTNCDFFLRVRARELREAQQMVQDFRGGALGRLCLAADTLVGVTKPRQYINQELSPELTRELNSARYRDAEPQFAVVIPVKKSARWWNLPEPERRKAIETHTRKSLSFLDRVKRELYHSTGLDDLDFITYFEAADLKAFQELCIELVTIPENEYHTRWGQPVLLGAIHTVEEAFTRLVRPGQSGYSAVHKETRES